MRISYYVLSILFFIGLVSMISASETNILENNEYDIAYLDSMSIKYQPGSGRPYVFSGSGSTFLYGSTQKIAEEGWMGFHWGEIKLWDDFIVMIDGIPLDRSEAEVDVRPHMVSFQWNIPGQVEKKTVLTIKPVGVDRDDLDIRLSGGQENSELCFFLVLPSETYLPEHKRHKPYRFLPFRIPVSPEDSVWCGIGSLEKFGVRQIQQLGDSKRDPSLKRLKGKEIWGASFEGDRFELTFSYASTPESLSEKIGEIYNGKGEAARNRKEWLLDEINRSYFRCSDERFNKAFNWAKVQLAGLFFKDDQSALLWAGLPWFNDCWGRDTFISLPGACLVQGKFIEARQILTRFAQWQEKDPASPDWGKIPNRVRGGEISYNTADGTGWFAKEVYEYGLYSGDTDLWREFLEPGSGALWMANEGTIEHRIDNHGLNVHGDADTWMDAKGPDGAWSPRGDRAIEIQVLWLNQLEVSLEMLNYLDYKDFPEDTKNKWEKTADRLRKIIPEMYVRPNGVGLFDHLDSDGIPDRKIRPNQLYALTIPVEPIIDEQVHNSIIETVKDNCVYDWGVASLSQFDDDFHPYHQTHHYPKDAAYHMGIVWTWLSGPFKSATKSGWKIVNHETGQILEWGAAGTLSENLDAIPREGNRDPYVSGTVSQTWSLAEYIRTIYQDYIGLEPDIRNNRKIGYTVRPHIPSGWNHFSVDAWVSGEKINIVYEGGDEIIVTADDSAKPVVFYVEKIIEPDDEKYLEPYLNPELRSLKPPPYPVLTSKQVHPASGTTISILDIDDPLGDDIGDGDYGYPSAPYFEPGMFDLTGFQMKEDHQNYYFKLVFNKLVDPGWHSEYGFQLTFATLAIRTGEEGKTRRDAGRNSGWKLKKKYAADRFIHVGGGYIVEDGEGNILASHLPDDARYPLGDVSTGEISFAVPRSILHGDPTKWKITILTGAQDDHGGAGVGEFRAVSKEGGMWEGSRNDKNKSNVYDWLIWPE